MRMKSPFPGMDPYIEDRGLWPDFHDDLLSEIKRTLAPALPERYFVQLGERSYVVVEGADVKTATSCEAVTMRAFIDERFRESFIEIYTADPEIRLVTCIEIL